MAIVCFTAFNAPAFAQWGWPLPPKDDDAHDVTHEVRHEAAYDIRPSATETPSRGGAINLDINYPGAGIRYFLSDETAAEIRTQYDKNDLITGSRFYWYPPFTADPKFSPYLCAEGDYLSFKNTSTNGNGFSGGAFAGIEYSLNSSFSLQMDMGGEYFSIKDKVDSLTQTGLEFILNFGINFYIKTGAARTHGTEAIDEPYIRARQIGEDPYQ